MKLYECNPGDIVAIRVDGIVSLVYLGALNGASGSKKKKGMPTYALVHPVDPESLIVWPPRTCIDIDVETEVVEVIEPVAFRRRMLMKDRSTLPDSDRSADPLIG